MHQNAFFFRSIGMDRMQQLERLYTKVLASIQKEELKRARVFAASALLVAFSSVISGVFAVKYMVQGFLQSGFYSYVSLLFSDTDIVVASWKELFLSLTESLPFAGMTFSLIALAVLLASVRTLARNMRPHLIPSFIN